MPSWAKTAIPILRWFFPFRWLFVAIVALTVSGVALHRMERFGGLEWGLTEISHVWVGWASMIAWTGYLLHHVAVRWGSWASPQRLLGLAVSTASVLLLVTGAMLGLGMNGGPPAWAVPVHWWATWALIGLVVAHTFVAWKRWPKRAWRRIVEGPRSVRGASAAAAAATEEPAEASA
ncbi:MAG: hypothetical protein GY898_22745 [Proteobacteria bacterium]|nr:hypothetical protein [Pseudomonadota bacterium]